MKNKQIKTDSKKRSPLKNKPLRYAGKSIDEQIDKLFTDNLEPYLLISIFSIAMAGYEWMRFYINNPPSPKMMTFIAVLVILPLQGLVWVPPRCCGPEGSLLHAIAALG
jgi:hypothetical protein